MSENANKPLSADFFARPTLEVAEELLSCNLCREINGQVSVARITETEAYDGPLDKASHAHRGKTPRNAIMFGPPGLWYVYLCYGVHWLLNIVTGPTDYPAAVLIRGLESVSGPGRLTKSLQINGTFNHLPTSQKSGLWISKANTPRPLHIEKTPRIGVHYAGHTWSRKPYRFITKEGVKRKL